MARHGGRHGARRSWAGGVAVFLVVALTGYLLMTNLRVNRTTLVTADTADLVEQRVEQVDALRAEVDDLSSRLTALNDLVGTPSSSSEEAGSGTTLPTVHGPGVTVTLDDSPFWETAVDSSGSATNINDYVVHQQDIEAVVNALWAGGAESMMIQDQRVLFSSAVICSGNVLLLQGKQYSPPYTVSAIGPVDKMLAALDESEAVRTYRTYYSETGIWENAPYPGIGALLAELEAAGKVLMVASAKPEVMAVRVLEHFGLMEHLRYVAGASLNEARDQKSEAIRRCLERSAGRAVMVGDRLYDVRGAHENGIGAIGVLYGYGGRQELEEAGADALAEDVPALRQLLLTGTEINTKE